MNLASFDFLALFFLLGILAGFFRSDLKFHEAAVAFVSSFLLLSIGLKGGFSFAKIQDIELFLRASALGLMSSFFIPLFYFYTLKRKLGTDNAAALAACYGSVSVVTFVAASNYLQFKQVSYSDYNTALLALMEIPAIVVALYLGMKSLTTAEQKKSSEIIKKVLSSKSFVLLVGGFFIGIFLNDLTWNSLKPLFVDSFKGILALYLLSLGIEAQSRFSEIKGNYLLYALVSFVLPFIIASIFMVLGTLWDIGVGNVTLLGVLVGSASYIAAPACVQMSLKKANPGLYVSLPLAVTFSFNIFLGIPLYLFIAKKLNILLNGV